jgi:hypothetical protein
MTFIYAMGRSDYHRHCFERQHGTLEEAAK